jgi:hypothetical protein
MRMLSIGHGFKTSINGSIAVQRLITLVESVDRWILGFN